jgi:hypothetical protein
VLTSEVGDLITDLLLDGLRPSRDVYATCPHCSHRFPHSLPDLSTRIGAATKLIEEVEGKLKKAAAPPLEKLNRLAARLRGNVSQPTDEELAQLLAGQQLGLIADEGRPVRCERSSFVLGDMALCCRCGGWLLSRSLWTALATSATRPTRTEWSFV